MPDKLQQRIASLEAEIRILREENLLLTEHAEEALLLRTVAEVAGWSEDPSALVSEVLERISVLRDIPLCACGYIRDSAVELPWCYASFSETVLRVRLVVPQDFLENWGGRNSAVLSLPSPGYRLELDDRAFVARTLFLLPFKTHRIAKGIFVFGSAEACQNWSGPQVFLRQAVDTVAARLDRLDLAGELQLINRELDQRVRVRTEELMQRNRELRQLQALLKNVINSMPSVLIGLDADGKVLQWNHEAERVSGCPADQARGKPLDEVYPALLTRLVEKGFDFGSSKISSYPRVRLKGVDGRQLLTDMTVYPLQGDGACGAVIRVDDVGDRVRLDEMMIQAEKMLSVGGLAAGMAHEINNPLAGILQNLQVVQNRLSPDLARNREMARECDLSLESIRTYLEKRGILGMLGSAVDNGRRAAEIVENILSFSRKTESKQAPHDLADLLERTLSLLSNDYDLEEGYDFRKIEIVREFESGVPSVRCEETKIQQVLLNILRNGAQAMENNHHGRNSRFVLKLMRSGNMVQIDICDNGPGMNAETCRRVFEPFFSTKGVKGTGLGLSVSYFIVTEQHGGELRVESTPGQGSCFIVRLPIAGG